VSHLDTQTLAVSWMLTSVMVAIAAVIDFRQFRVPNLLTLPLCASGLLFHLALGGLPGLQSSVWGLAVGGLLLVLFYVLGVMGAGDVKLLAGVGAWLGAPHTFYVFLVAALAAGVHSIVALTVQRRLGQMMAFLQVMTLQLCTLGKHVAWAEPVDVALQRPDRRRHVMPFAVMIAIGLTVVAIRGLFGPGDGSV
jgi:prepilin peptidase CpaA